MASIQGIYLAFFGRPADPQGLAFWEEQTNGGADLSVMLDALSGTEEYQERFDGQDEPQIIASIYQSLFNREPEAEGLAFFEAALADGTLTLSSIAVAILDGAQGEDAIAVSNKETAAASFTASLDTDEKIEAYSGAEAIAIAQQLIAGVGPDVGSIPTDEQIAETIEEITGGDDGVPGDGDGDNGGGGGDPTFTASVDDDGVVSFEGSATGAISLTVSDGAATFTRQGIEATVGSFSEIALGSGDSLEAGADAVDGIELTGEGSVTIAGADGPQTLSVSTSGTNSIAGGEGADSITLGEGNDTVSVAFEASSSASTAALTPVLADTFEITIAGEAISVAVAELQGEALADAIEDEIDDDDVSVEFDSDEDTLTITDAAGREISGATLVTVGEPVEIDDDVVITDGEPGEEASELADGIDIDNGDTAVAGAEIDDDVEIDNNGTSEAIFEISSDQVEDAAVFALQIEGLNSDEPIEVDVSGAESRTDLAGIIQAALREADGDDDAISAEFSSSDEAIIVTDEDGRDFSNPSLREADVAAVASVATFGIADEAEAASFEVVIEGLNDGDPITVDLDGSSGDELASVLQAALRDEDGDAEDISVAFEDGEFTITDDAGRDLSALSVTSGAVEGSPSTAEFDVADDIGADGFAITIGEDDFSFDLEGETGEDLAAAIESGIGDEDVTVSYADGVLTVSDEAGRAISDPSLTTGGEPEVVAEADIENGTVANATESTLDAMDVITNFTAGTDLIDVGQDVTLVDLVTDTESEDLEAALETAFEDFAGAEAGILILGEGDDAQVYAYANDGNGEFDASSDIVIALAGVDQEDLEGVEIFANFNPIA
jgi:hypothetical protein